MERRDFTGKGLLRIQVFATATWDLEVPHIVTPSSPMCHKRWSRCPMSRHSERRATKRRSATRGHKSRSASGRIAGAIPEWPSPSVRDQGRTDGKAPSSAPSAPPLASRTQKPASGGTQNGLRPTQKSSIDGKLIPPGAFGTALLWRRNAPFLCPAKRGFRVLWKRRRCNASQARMMARTVLARGCATDAPSAAAIGGPPRQRLSWLARSADTPPLFASASQA